ncbi:MAG: transposase [Candidatus Chisholmbacteria bacterium]|nr:transposase [Candidatus Chisholmbacteria bacterium]
MPHRHTIRTYIINGHYHVYNRGVEKRLLYLDQYDYRTFIDLLSSYLTPKQPLAKDITIHTTPYWRSKLEADEVVLLCFCLMPNHFHLLLKQNSPNGITKFMRRVSNAYVRYFNKKYQRVGALFQGKFKAALIETDPYLLHLSRYIHLNPVEVGPLNGYIYSSYPDYLGFRNTPWVKTQPILSYFKTARKSQANFSDLLSYESFVRAYPERPQDVLENLILD